jgi:hypothetical protein
MLKGFVNISLRPDNTIITNWKDVLLMFVTNKGTRATSKYWKPTTKSELNQYLSSSKKLGFTEKDSLFQVNIGFRVQSRAGFEKTDGVCNSRRRN